VQTKRKQLPNAAATWLNEHKDGLLPTMDELSDLPDDYSFDESEYPVVESDYEE
jgi:hypothetical protein